MEPCVRDRGDRALDDGLVCLEAGWNNELLLYSSQTNQKLISNTAERLELVAKALPPSSPTATPTKSPLKETNLIGHVTPTCRSCDPTSKPGTPIVGGVGFKTPPTTDQQRKKTTPPHNIPVTFSCKNYHHFCFCVKEVFVVFSCLLILVNWFLKV